MFLKALQTIIEKFPVKGGQSGQVEKTPKRIGVGHIFWHPDEKRAERLLGIEPPNVAKSSAAEAAKYVEEGLRGLTKDGNVIREPMIEKDFPPEVLQAYKDRERKKLEAETKTKGKGAKPEKAEPDADDTGDVDEEEDGPDPTETGDAKPKAKGKGKK